MRKPRVGGKKEEDDLNPLKLLLLPILISIFTLILTLIRMIILKLTFIITFKFILIHILLIIILILILIFIFILIPIPTPFIRELITADPVSDQSPMQPCAPLPAPFEIGSARTTPALHHLLDHPQTKRRLATAH